MTTDIERCRADGDPQPGVNQRGEGDAVEVSEVAVEEKGGNGVPLRPDAGQADGQLAGNQLIVHRRCISRDVVQRHSVNATKGSRHRTAGAEHLVVRQREEPLHEGRSVKSGPAFNDSAVDILDDILDLIRGDAGPNAHACKPRVVQAPAQPNHVVQVPRSHGVGQLVVRVNRGGRMHVLAPCGEGVAAEASVSAPVGPIAGPSYPRTAILGTQPPSGEKTSPRDERSGSHRPYSPNPRRIMTASLPPTDLSSVASGAAGSGSEGVDDALVRDARTRIRAVHERGTRDASLSVGSILLEMFYGNQLTCYRGQGRTPVSLRALAKEPGPGLSASYLWTSLAVLNQMELFPVELGEALSLAHHRLLLSLHDPSVRLAVATKAVEEGWSKQVLRAHVAALLVLSPKSRPGRKPRPAHARAVNALEEFANHAKAALADTSKLREHPDQLRAMRVRLAPLVELADDLLDALDEALGDAATAAT